MRGAEHVDRVEKTREKGDGSTYLANAIRQSQRSAAKRERVASGKEVEEGPLVRLEMHTLVTVGVAQTHPSVALVSAYARMCDARNMTVDPDAEKAHSKVAHTASDFPRSARQAAVRGMARARNNERANDLSKSEQRCCAGPGFEEEGARGKTPAVAMDHGSGTLPSKALSRQLKDAELDAGKQMRTKVTREDIAKRLDRAMEGPHGAVVIDAADAADDVVVDDVAVVAKR